MNTLYIVLSACVSTSPVAEYGDPSVLALTAGDFLLQARDGIDAQVFDSYNAANGTDQISLYDSSWGTSVNLNQYKILVSIGSDHLIDAVRPYGVTGALTIPSGGYVVAVNGTSLPYLAGLAVDDELNVVATSTCAPRSDGVPVFLYHSLGTTDAAFETHLQAIEKAGYNTISLDQLEMFLDGPEDCGPQLPENPILLSFDDGYQNQFDFAPPLLAKYGMVGTFFIITSYPGTTSTWAHWADISDAVTKYPDNVELACHSHAAHFQVGGVSEYLLMTEKQAYDDMVECRDQLMSNTGVDTTSLAWPFGTHTADLIETARDAGFTMTFTTWPGINHFDNDDAMGLVRRFGFNVTSTWASSEATLNRWYVCD